VSDGESAGQDPPILALGGPGVRAEQPAAMRSRFVFDARGEECGH
jgi:hypothetical protein